MDTGVLLQELVNGLKPVQIHKMARHNKAVKYRDQLYLVHLEKNSTTLMDLQGIRVLFNIVLKCERYKPVSRRVTQCSNCLLFGHGTKNCHMVSRCIKAAHKVTSKACPKRFEYIEIRKKASTRNQPGRKKVPEMNDQNFPPVPRRPITVLSPLPLNQRLAAARSTATATQAQTSGAPANSGQQTTAAPQPQDLPTALG
ncbi:uncharacterized protein LOC135700677 [Ochlerotatus camptorhynchus]|uniref:uncharacterized protein LOC135700677 n=1 Tax=Ochlerotatus camptorhynchus TaxID=644619 RepID=UPI0031D98A5E